MNPNDITAEIYDIVSAPLKGSAITDAEISLMNFMAEPGAKVLDIGGGTGRHALPLSQLGFKVTVVDVSQKMLKALKAKITDSSIQIITKDILSCDFGQEKFDLIILMWNSFNEIALTKDDAITLLQKSKEVLNPKGRILINIDDATKIDPGHFDFKTSFMQNGLTYNLHWSTTEFDPQTNTSLSKEHIQIQKDENTIQELDTFIKQRYWSLDQIKDLANQAGLKLEELNIKESAELYLQLN